MSLNRKRRIFRSGGTAGPPSRLLSGPGTLAAALVGALVLGGGTWLILRASEVPSRQPLTGHISAEPRDVAVIDAGTLRLKDRVVRLDGIEPPARDATCTGAAGATLACRSAAANALSALVSDGVTDCSLHGHDGMGRPLANCVTNGQGLNEAMLAAGWAEADPHDPALAAIEAKARAAGRGQWSGSPPAVR